MVAALWSEVLNQKFDFYICLFIRFFFLFACYVFRHISKSRVYRRPHVQMCCMGLEADESYSFIGMHECV